MTAPQDEHVNPARERLRGGWQPFEISYKPDAADFRRWLLSDAERTVRAEEQRLASKVDDV
ncbi:hypothetical protein ABIE18_001877 [Arthrobacter sp. 2762]